MEKKMDPPEIQNGGPTVLETLGKVGGDPINYGWIEDS